MGCLDGLEGVLLLTEAGRDLVISLPEKLVLGVRLFFIIFFKYSLLVCTPLVVV